MDVHKIGSVELKLWAYPIELQALRIEPIGNWLPLPVEAAT